MPEDKPIINPSNDHDLLIRIDTRIMDMLRENRDFKIGLAALQAEKCDKEDIMARAEIVDKRFIAVDEKVNGNEIRIRKLERVAYIAIGIMGVLQALIGIFVK